MDAPQATQTQDATASVLSEAKFSEMVAGALQAHGIEKGIDDVLRKISPGNGSAIIGPSGQSVRLNTPSAQDFGLMCLQALRTVLQTQRITLVALNDIDSRLRLQAAQQASTGSVQRADTPGKPVPGTIGMGPAETPGASTGE